MRQTLLAIVCGSGLIATSGVLDAQQNAAGETPRSWVGLEVTCTIKPPNGSARDERIARATDGSQLAETRRVPTEGTDLQLRNRTTQQFYRKLPSGEWLSAPLPGRPAPPTRSSFERPGWTLTESSFEGRAALKLVTPNGSQLLVPEFDYFSVEQDNATLSVRCKDLKKAAPAAAEFSPPAGVTPRVFPTVASLNTWVELKKNGGSASK
jgi:hypothetical protein